MAFFIAAAPGHRVNPGQRAALAARKHRSRSSLQATQRVLPAVKNKLNKQQTALEKGDKLANHSINIKVFLF